MKRAIGLLMLLFTACAPDFGDRLSAITAPQVIAAYSDPAEVLPGGALQLHVVVAAPGGTLAADDADYRACAAPRPLSDDGALPESCLNGAANYLGRGSSIDTLMPKDACAAFGPSVPAGGMFRARPADATGGYYQPIIVRVAGKTAALLARVKCDLPNAPAAAANDYRMRYTLNQNPGIGDVSARYAGAPVALDALPPNTDINLSFTIGADAREPYVVYESGDTLAMRVETLDVAWFTDAGELAQDRTGEVTANQFHTPAAGAVHLWVVLRDDRGGTDVRALEARVAN
jgi:hypothetical protein